MAKSKPAAGVSPKNPTTERKQKVEKSKRPAKKRIDVSAKLVESETVKALAVVEEKPILVPAPASQSPYQLDKAQSLKAARALLKHISSTTASTDASKPNLLQDPEDPTDTAIPLWLVLNTKKYITDTKKLKPMLISLPNPLLPPSTTVCLIVKDPQRYYKDLIATASLQNIVTKVVGIGKLKKKYKAFEVRRQLLDSHDIFLADDRIVTSLPSALGSTFYRKSSKVPAPITLTGNNSPAYLKKQVEKALQSTFVHLSPAATISIRVALSSFMPEQVVENIAKVVATMAEKKIPGGFKNIKSLHIKSPNSASLPIYMVSEVYSEEDVLKPEEEKGRLLAVAKRAAERKERKANKKKRKGLSDSKPADEKDQAGEKETETPKKKAKIVIEEK